MTIIMLLYALTFTNLLHIDIETGARTIYTKFPLIRAGPQIKASLFSIIDTNIKISAALKKAPPTNKSSTSKCGTYWISDHNLTVTKSR